MYIYIYIYIYIDIYVLNSNVCLKIECLKFVQVALLYKLDVKCWKSKSSEVSDPSVEKIKLVDMLQKSRYKDFLQLN